MVDLRVEFAGLKLKNPIVSGAGPNTKNFDQALKGMKAGCGAIVVRSLHLERLDERRPPRREFWRLHTGGKDFLKDYYSFQSTGAPAERVSRGIPPGMGGAVGTPTLPEWQEEVAKIVRASKQYDCAIIASIGWCGSALASDDLWEGEAKAMAEAGVDAIELHNGPSPATEPGRFIMADPEKYLLNPIRIAKRAGGKPTFSKVPVDCCDVVAACRWAQSAGADGVVPVTRWMSITVDIEAPERPAWRGPGFGGPWSAPIMTGYIYRMRSPMRGVGHMASRRYQQQIDQDPDSNPAVTIPIIPSGGARTGADVVTYIMAGASAVQICAQILVEGYKSVGRIQREITGWMQRKGLSRLDEVRGTLKVLEPALIKRELPQRVAQVDEALCTGCEVCVDPCTDEAIAMANGVAVVEPTRCEGCLNCVQVCPANAIQMVAI